MGIGEVLFWYSCPCASATQTHPVLGSADHVCILELKPELVGQKATWRTSDFRVGVGVAVDWGGGLLGKRGR
jgi:hypothetical protein